MELTLNKYDLEQKIETWLIQYIGEHLEVSFDKIDVTVPFESYGMDSQLLVWMVGDIIEWLGFNLEPTIGLDYKTIERLSTYLADLASPQNIAERVFGSALASLQDIAERVFGSADIARDWLARPNPALGNQIPNELLKTPDGEKVVYELLMRIDYGVYS
jgi:putative toxin-antitoxin system antitoxin component (TIGR02293 family)